MKLDKIDRIFAFGCSYTKYQWPTWADIIIHDTEIEGYNYGLSGLGNVGIMHRILEADIRHKFNENDCILISWTSWGREDRFINGMWQRYGCVYNNPYYNKKFWKYCSVDNDLIKNAGAIILINKLYQDKIKFQNSMFPIGRPETIKDDYPKNYNTLENFYLKNINIDDDLSWESYKNFQYYTVKDIHPTVQCHLNFVQDMIKHPCKTSTVEYFLNIDSKIKNIVSYSDKNFQSKINFWDSKDIGFR